MVSFKMHTNFIEANVSVRIISLFILPIIFQTLQEMLYNISPENYFTCDNSPVGLEDRLLSMVYMNGSSSVGHSIVVDDI